VFVIISTCRFAEQKQIKKSTDWNPGYIVVEKKIKENKHKNDFFPEKSHVLA
jgi:hypothetical protein